MRAITKRRLRRGLTAAGVSAAALFLGVVVWVTYLTLTLPRIHDIGDYQPPQSTRIYSDDGHLVAELARERRRVVPIEQIPEHVVRAFLAAEDAGFYEHEGLDYLGILRAALKNLRPGAHLQGASTITQQTVKTLITGGERSYTRKLREALLTRQLEQMLTKDEILHLYLNQIYFGAGAHGVEEAAREYFGKSVREVTLAEAAYLASAPKNPSRYTLREDPEASKTRQRYVLEQMLEHGWAEADAVKAAIEAPVLRPAPQPPYLHRAGHYAEHVRRALIDAYGEEQVYTAGLTVYTGMHAEMQVAAQDALRVGLEDIGRKHGWPGAALRIEVDRFDAYREALHEAFDAAMAHEKLFTAGRTSRTTWIWDLSLVGERSLADAHSVRRGMRVVELEDLVRVVGLVSHVDNVRNDTFIDLGGAYARVPLSSLQWARRFSPRGETPPPRNASEVFNRGDLVQIELQGSPKGTYEGKPLIEALLVPRPKVEGALVALDPHTRLVRALVGGYDPAPGGLIRAVQAKRQPGSAFKPILYAAGIAHRTITPVSMCPDSPVVIRDPWTGKNWKPENYDGEYDGNITYRQALTRSKNTCSVKLIDRVGVEPVLEQAAKMGIRSELPKNLTLALGTGEVAPIELANAYATIAAGGLVAEPIFIRKVVDPTGVVLEQSSAELEPALDPAAAYVVAQMMRSVIEEGTAARAQVLDRILAGKTGTSQESRDVWFSGFSPELVGTVWVGFDDNKPLGSVYGASGALPIWIRFMGRALVGVPSREFTPPEDVVTIRVDRATGAPTASQDDALSQPEVFIAGTEPNAQTAPLANPFLIDDEG